MNDDISRKAKEKALLLLNYRMRTETELRDKLRKSGFEEEYVQEAVEYVYSFGYLNDARYAEQYASTRFGSKGKSAIRRELREKGVSDEDIQAAFENLPDDEHSAAMTLLLKKAGTPHNMDEKEYRRVFSFLMRRGFGTGTVISVLKEYQNNVTDQY